MQNVQNAEIQQRVINLVDFYRTKVGKESQIAKDAKKFYDDFEELNKKEISNGGFLYQYSDFENPKEHVWVDLLMVNEQLLGHFYAEVAGENADKEILDELLSEVYDKTIFSEEDESFLKEHFKEMVNYIFQTPCDEYLEWVNRHDGRDAYVIPNELRELIVSRVDIPVGSIIYNPLPAFGQFTDIFKGCKFLFSGKSTMTKLAVFANNIDAEFLGKEIPSAYDAFVLYLQNLLDEDDPDNSGKEDRRVNLIHEAYDALNDGGKMVLICPNKYLVLKTINKDDIVEIIQLPNVMSYNTHNSYSLIIAEKGRKEVNTSMIDARFASQGSKKKHFTKIFDWNAFCSMIQNNGCDVVTGLRKMVSVPSSELREGLLLPQVYVIERPSEKDKPVPLSSICQLVTERVRDVKHDLPLDTPRVSTDDLSVTYRRPLDISSLKRVGYPNNPANLKIRDFDENNFLSLLMVDETRTYEEQHTEQQIAIYRSSIYLDGKRDAVLLHLDPNETISTALYRSTGKPLTVGASIFGQNLIWAFYPQKDVDVFSLVAILNMPIVYRQMQVYMNFGLYNHLDDIIVPTDKRIINDEIQRLKNEEEAFTKQEKLLQTKKTEYINEVRMRKHDLGQKVFDLINTEDLMRYYVENRETETDLWPQIEEQLNHFRKTINELSDMLDQLSQEERFGTPELLDLNGYFSGLQHSSNINGFKLSYLLDRDSILDLQLSRMKDMDMIDVSSIKAMPTVFMAKSDLQRVVSNVLANAQKHGFLDRNRKDYEVNIRLEFNADKGMYQIDFRNNGKPLPDGMNKMRYGIKGEKAGQTAGTGLGGSIVKSIVEHYNGDYNVFMDGDWTVIRVYLPIVI